MPKRYFHNIHDLRNNLHKEGASIIEYGEKNIPCIFINPDKYFKIIREVAGKRLVVDVMLDIFSDGRQIFIDIFMNYLDYDFSENYLFYANQMPEFFKCLSDTGIIAICPQGNRSTSESHILMIQIPKLDAAKKVYTEIINAIRNSNR